ncbi:hypothetical protein CH274_13100 [Rhodococcus sp. 06-418-5]|uniref:hypothetical protein n=1 Tax=Rhodococcus sp. 06-418-5 TaxID=2022507 RepID=UPI000B9BF80E|nr:hypothetical protein [Rhodococcus sp. 06-418-5]OZC80168.1 hypothetical protein CH274_13100 [Rhodococcus sp. 06-418-5]
MTGMLVQQSRAGRRSVTWSCGHTGCDFTVVKDMTGAQPGDHFELPEIAVHVAEAHRVFGGKPGVEFCRDDWAPISLADLTFDEGE